MTPLVLRAPGGYREGMRRPLTFSLLLSVLAIGACGSDSTPSSGDLADAGSKASATARDLTERTRALQEEVAKTARALVSDPTRREQALDDLEGQEDTARELADEAESELPEGAEVRDKLVAANERTAEAADELQRFAEDNEQAALSAARTALRQGETQLRSASDDLLGNAPAAARKALEEARDRLPAIPTP